MMIATIRMSAASRQVNCSEKSRSKNLIGAVLRTENAKCRMQNAKRRGRSHFAFCILHFAFVSSRRLDRGEDLQEIDRLPHVVHADDRCAAYRRRGDCGERAVDAL